MATKNYSDLYLVNNADGKYFRCDTTFVKSAKERLFSTKPSTAQILPNGIFGFLGSHIDNEIRELLTPTADLIKNQIPVIIHNPEINYWEVSKAQGALGMYRNKSGQALRTFPLEVRDEVSLSSDFFDLTGKTTGSKTDVEVGDIFVLQANLTAGSQLLYSATAPTATNVKSYFKVTKVYKSFIPSFLGGTGSYFPNSYAMADIELIIA